MITVAITCLLYLLRLGATPEFDLEPILQIADWPTCNHQTTSKKQHVVYSKPTYFRAHARSTDSPGRSDDRWLQRPCCNVRSSSRLWLPEWRECLLRVLVPCITKSAHICSLWAIPFWCQTRLRHVRITTNYLNISKFRNIAAVSIKEFVLNS